MRFKTGAARMDLPFPWEVDELEAGSARCSTACPRRTHYIRPIAFRGAPEIMLVASRDLPVSACVFAVEVERDVPDPMRGAIVAGRARLEPRDPGRVEGLRHVREQLPRAADGVRAQGADVGVLLDGAGRLAEASTSNLFLIRDGALVTPSIDADVFPGITRRSVLEIAERIGVEAVERHVDPRELRRCEGAFLASTMLELRPFERDRRRALRDRRAPAVPPHPSRVRRRDARMTRGGLSVAGGSTRASSAAACAASASRCAPSGAAAASISTSSACGIGVARGRVEPPERLRQRSARLRREGVRALDVGVRLRARRLRSARAARAERGTAAARPAAARRGPRRARRARARTRARRRASRPAAPPSRGRARRRRRPSRRARARAAAAAARRERGPGASSTASTAWPAKPSAGANIGLSEQQLDAVRRPPRRAPAANGVLTDSVSASSAPGRSAASTCGSASSAAASGSASRRSRRRRAPRPAPGRRARVERQVRAHVAQLRGRRRRQSTSVSALPAPASAPANSRPTAPAPPTTTTCRELGARTMPRRCSQMPCNATTRRGPRR